MADETGQGIQDAASAGENTLLEEIIYKGKMVRDDSQMPYARDLIGELVTQILDEGMTVSADTAAMLNSRVAQIDQLITDQLNEIMHQKEFQKLEASWRGLHFFCDEHRDRCYA